ncbi:MAG: hypothetical protein U0R26_03585 [Solirubrobacterales bacterium]
MKGTIFEKSTTSLQLWFYAMFLMASTRCGISAKQLERELGVTYKTAWRMSNKIRNELMNDEGDERLSGDAEVDETSWAGAAARHSPSPWPRLSRAVRTHVDPSSLLNYSSFASADRLSRSSKSLRLGTGISIGSWSLPLLSLPLGVVF